MSKHSPMPELAPSGVVHDGVSIGHFGINSAARLPDVRSFRKKFGLLIPATNTSMEHELWTLIGKNPKALRGVGLHTANIITPKPRLRTEADLESYKQQFVAGLADAVSESRLAEPDSLIVGMSLEHILSGIDAIQSLMSKTRSNLPVATWHDASLAALKKYNAKRIGLLTPFDKKGNENAVRLFTDLGFEVVSSVGFACAHALHIAHVPDEAKERAIRELLAVPKNRLDAVVQCGTNMSLIDVAEKLEPELKIPILGINATTFWYALRQNGIEGAVSGGGRILREF